MDSTFISALPLDPHDHSYELGNFDHTLDNLSMMDNGEGGILSELLREKGSRSRFISDESFFSRNDVHDKHLDTEEEEHKGQLPLTAGRSLFQSLAKTHHGFCAPVDLLGIPMEEEDEEEQMPSGA
jgi:hypothetical protein